VHLGLEFKFLMAAVAERFVFRMPTAAKADGGAAGEVEGFTFSVVECELTLNAQRAVVSYVYSCFGQVILLLNYKVPFTLR
jgi:hypothetical protein